MPYTVSWHEDDPVIFVKFNGNVTGRHINKALEEVRADARFCPGRHQIWDCQQISKLDVDWPELQALKNMAIGETPEFEMIKGKIAIIATREIVYSCSKVIVAMTKQDGYKKKVVRTVNEAIDWIAVE